MTIFDAKTMRFDPDPIVGALPASIRVYLVGGAVRDHLRGVVAKDCDWLVVGATPHDLLTAGFRPVGADFPVFLHPVTHEEYALARTERKTAPGYRGFVFHAAPDVSLEDDLARRDLTINAMAVDGAGRLIDPFGGQHDLRRNVLRHVGPAFSEDPVRLLRLARLRSTLSDARIFTIAVDTCRLCENMVAVGEVDALVAERVWQEMALGLLGARPALLVDTLQMCGAWPRLAGAEAAELLGRAEVLAGLSASSAALPGLAQRWAAWWLLAAAHSSRAARLQDELAVRWKVPGELTALATTVLKIAAQELPEVSAGATDATPIVDLIQQTDALRKPVRFAMALDVVRVVARPDVSLPRWSSVIESLRRQPLQAAIDAAKRQGQALPEAVRQARIAYCQAYLHRADAAPAAK
ncbi:MAG: multifunctional CCA tRNA nucleotidyl transferase/2'3'-cyclic phosphodiesterase/2'nucleotidase/phosphatase [Burkholderiaceae bacterium]